MTGVTLAFYTGIFWFSKVLHGNIRLQLVADAKFLAFFFSHVFFFFGHQVFCF